MSRYGRCGQPPLLCLQRSWHFPRCSLRLLGTQGRGSSRNLGPTGPVGRLGPYQGTRILFSLFSLSFSLSIYRSFSFFFIDVSVRMIRRGAGGWCRKDGDQYRVGQEGPTEARQALYERGGHRGPPLMFDSCVWAAGPGRRRRSVREECEDA